jgi:uncharacterized protein YdaU (DUF1376 family)
MKTTLTGEFFCVDRWIQSQAFGMSIEARGLYREMLSRAWLNGGWLPNDHAAIRRLIGASELEWKRCWPLIEHYWRIDAAGRLVNDVQVTLYEAAKTRFERARRGGAGRAQLRLLG